MEIGLGVGGYRKEGIEAPSKREETRFPHLGKRARREGTRDARVVRGREVPSRGRVLELVRVGCDSGGEDRSRMDGERVGALAGRGPVDIKKMIINEIDAIDKNRRKNTHVPARMSAMSLGCRCASRR
jgi:hypothetical protein